MNENATYHVVHPTYIQSTNEKGMPAVGINFKLEYSGNTFPVNMPHVVGMHNIGQALAAIACASEIGCDLLASINAISEYTTPPGRLSLIEGINDSTIIDDTYNSSPIAMESAIEVLRDIKSNRKIAVIGDMLELGKFTEEEHRAVGEKIYGIADILITVGLRAKTIAQSALGRGFLTKNVHAFDTAILAGDFLKEKVKKGDLILIKGSQGVRLERIVEAIMAHPELKTKLLCRQEKEWKNR